MNAIAAGPSHGSIRHWWNCVEAAAASSGTSSRPWYASGIIIIIACGSERPASTSSSSTLSKLAESDPPGRTTGSTFCRSSPKSSEASCDSRARIQLTLPRSVLISPLWAISRYGWASSQLGNVLVEKREWTSASALVEPLVAQVGK